MSDAFPKWGKAGAERGGRLESLSEFDELGAGEAELGEDFWGDGSGEFGAGGCWQQAEVSGFGIDFEAGEDAREDGESSGVLFGCFSGGKDGGEEMVDVDLAIIGSEYELMIRACGCPRMSFSIRERGDRSEIFV